jgi:hypothetical protein
MAIAVLVFIASLIGVGGAYFWKQYLLSQQASYKTQLAEREKQFNLDLVEQLKQVNVQIDTARQLLTKHIAMSQIFEIVQRMTVSDIRFTSLEVAGPTAQKNGASLSMHGYGKDLSAVAFQSDVLGQLAQYGLQKIIKNPMISDPVLDANGSVSFGFSATIDPASLSYTQLVTGADTTEATSTAQ